MAAEHLEELWAALFERLRVAKCICSVPCMPTAVFLHGPHDARAVPFNLREGRPGEVPLRVGAVGLCGSGFCFYKESGSGAARSASPFVPGHEVGGWLESDMPHRQRIALPLGAVQAGADVSEIAGWTRGDPDGDTCTMAASEVRRRAPGVKFARRMGEAYPCTIKLVKSGRWTSPAS